MCPEDKFYTDLGCLPKNPIPFVDSVYGMGLGLISGVGLLFFIYGGYLILTSRGDALQVKKGREYITYSVIGIMLALSGYALYQIIARDVLKIPGFS